MDFEDYYEILGIADDASEADIKAAFRKTRSRYRNLTGSPNKAQARKAERMIDTLAAAEKVLYDAQARAQYDAQLADYRANGPKTEQSSAADEERIRQEYERKLQQREQELRREYEQKVQDGRQIDQLDDEEFLREYEQRAERARRERATREEHEHKRASEQQRSGSSETQRWSDVVAHYLSQGDYQNLHHAAQKLVESDPQSSQGWYALGLAQWKQSDLQAATQSVTRARQLTRGYSERLTELEALIASDGKQYAQALHKYTELLQRNPREPIYASQYIRLTNLSGNPLKAIMEAERALQSFPNDPLILRQYAYAIVADADSHSIRFNNALYMTSQEHVSRNMAALAKLSRIPNLPGDIRPEIQRLQQNIRIATKRKWRTDPLSILALVFISLNIIGVLFVSFNLFFGGTVGGFLGYILYVVFVLGMVILYIYFSNPPTWRVNRKWLRSRGVRVP